MLHYNHTCAPVFLAICKGHVFSTVIVRTGIFKQVLGGQLDLNAGPCKSLSRDAKQLLLCLLTRDVKVVTW